MKSVGKIESEISQIVYNLNLSLIIDKFDLDLQAKVIITWVIECALLGCTLVPSIKSVGEIASEIASCLVFYLFLGNLDLDL